MIYALAVVVARHLLAKPFFLPHQLTVCFASYPGTPDKLGE